MNPPNRAPFASALLETLRKGTRRPVFLSGEVPPDAEHPYSVLSVVPEGYRWGETLGDDVSFPRLQYQVSCAGLRTDQVQALADRVRLTIVARHPAGDYQVAMDEPEGWHVIERCSEGYEGIVAVDGLPPNVVLTTAETFALSVTAA